MADYETPTSELEAVNAMLHSIGESPVVTIDDDTDPLPVDVDIAVRVLRSVNREVQVRGWQFNTEQEYPLSRDGDNFLPLPSNTLHADPDGSFASRDGIVRGSRLYDRTNHTYVWDTDVTVTIKLLLPFEELPEAARSYIAVRAGRKFQAGVVGSQVLASFTQEDEINALSLLRHEECDAGDFNVNTDNTEHFLAFVYRGGGTGPL